MPRCHVGSEDGVTLPCPGGGDSVAAEEEEPLASHTGEVGAAEEASSLRCLAKEHHHTRTSLAQLRVDDFETLVGGGGDGLSDEGWTRDGR